MAKKEQGIGRAWIRALADGPVAKLYIMHGEETYRRDAAIGILRQRFVPEGLAGFNELRLEGKGLRGGDLLEAVDGLPFMAERKLVIVRDYDLFAASNRDTVTALLASLSEHVCLIFIYDALAFKADRRTKLYTQLAEAGEIAEFTAAAPPELAQWVRARFTARKKRIEAPEIEYMTFRCGSLMTPLLNEIEKVAAYARDERITRADIEAVCASAAEAQVYELSDRLSARDYTGALTKLDELIAAREEPVMLCAVIGRQVRRLYFAALHRRAGKSVDALMKAQGLRFRFMAEKLLESAARMPLAGLRRAALLCEQADVALKSSRASGEDTLRMLIFELAQAFGGV